MMVRATDSDIDTYACSWPCNCSGIQVLRLDWPYATVRAALDSLKPSGLFELTLVQQRELEVASNLLMMMRWQEQVTKYQLKVGLPMAHAPAA